MSFKFTLVLGITLLVLSTLKLPCLADCPINFLQLQNKCYYFSRDLEQWTDAHYRCAYLNATLVTLKSKHNNKRLIEYLQKENLETKEWWIGARYDWKQRKWQWGATGKPVKFHHFVRNLAHKTKLEWHCAFLDQRYQFQWNADACTRKKYYICMQNDLDYQTIDDDNNNVKDNLIPVIVSRDYLEAEHLKNPSNGDNNQPGFMLAPGKATNSSLKPKGKPRPDRPQQRYACPKGYGSVRKTCYKFSKTKATWQDAYFNCTGDPSANATLAIIADKKFDQGVRRYAKRIGAVAHERWIGGIYDWQRTAWKWAANGVIIQHKEKDKDVLQWHCLVWSPLLLDRWTSDMCTQEKYFICQTAPQVFVPMEIRRRPSPQPKKTKNRTNQRKSEN